MLQQMSAINTTWIVWSYDPQTWYM